jgi:DNA polymerase-3 subunit epsilon
MVLHSPTFKQLAAGLKRRLQAKTLVCHNAPFDLCFLEAEFQRAGVSMPKVPVLDTLRLARRYFQFSHNNLGHIARSLGIEPQGWHRAGNDVQLLSKIFEVFLAEFSRKGARTLGDLLKL